jgi:predicted ATPase
VNLSLAAAHRLVSLIGAGGIGKTRLTLAVARQLPPQFADGVWLAELAPLADPALVPAAVAAARGLEFSCQRGLSGACCHAEREIPAARTRQLRACDRARRAGWPYVANSA